MTPAFVALVAFCFSMTIGVLWEFFEFGMDVTFKTDMQKDRIVQEISTVTLNPEGKNDPVEIRNITGTTIYYIENGENKEISVVDGFLDIGIRDTMKDLFVNFIGAVVFSILGLLYIKDRDEYKFAEKFIPKLKKKTSN